MIIIAKNTESPIMQLVTLLEHSWILIFLFTLIIVILILTWLLFKREKTLQLMKFSISPIGLKLSFELNQDHKLQTLALENIGLQNEVKALQSKVSKEQRKTLVIIVILFIILIINSIKSKVFK